MKHYKNKPKKSDCWNGYEFKVKASGGWVDNNSAPNSINVGVDRIRHYSCQEPQ